MLEVSILDMKRLIRRFRARKDNVQFNDQGIHLRASFSNDECILKQQPAFRQGLASICRLMHGKLTYSPFFQPSTSSL